MKILSGRIGKCSLLGSGRSHRRSKECRCCFLSQDCDFRCSKCKCLSHSNKPGMEACTIGINFEDTQCPSCNPSSCSLPHNMCNFTCMANTGEKHLSKMGRSSFGINCHSNPCNEELILDIHHTLG